MSAPLTFAGRTFEGPHDLRTWTPPARAGVYCLVVPDNGAWRAVYMGESSDLAQYAFPSSRGGRAGWLRVADFSRDMLVAVHWMPRATFEQRNAVARELIDLYEPECNEVSRSHSPIH